MINASYYCLENKSTCVGSALQYPFVQIVGDYLISTYTITENSGLAFDVNAVMEHDVIAGTCHMQRNLTNDYIYLNTKDITTVY